MNIKILFDKDSYNKNLHTGWGVSFLVDDKILFDTGEKGTWLIENMKYLSVDINKIKVVVISHDHWDHKNGLWKLLEENHKIKIYSCPHFGRRFKNKVKSYGGLLTEADRLTLIDDNVYTTGEIEGWYLLRYMPEQALILKTARGLVILTGCAHPGIVKIIENVKQNIPEKIYLVIGGFHLMGKHTKTIKDIINKFRDMEIEKVGPTHCTGKTAIEFFKKEYKDKFVEIKVGETIKV
ncbi:MAG: MBL fold metallo-hydrolase [Candidatus Omnitrophica bacterium]|nr:MBL fold metallo-hydrolase [Candidatus Omnitrophota bacterium]